MPAAKPKPGKEAVRSLLFAVAAMSALWIVFVAGFHPQEMLVGAACVAAAVGLLSAMWRAQTDHVAFHARDVAQVWRVPGQGAGDALLILRVLGRDLLGKEAAGSIDEVHSFDTAPPCGETLGRELLAVAYVTASPNSIVLGIDQKKGLLLMHQLAPSPTPELARKLGAGDRL